VRIETSKVFSARLKRLASISSPAVRSVSARSGYVFSLRLVSFAVCRPLACELGAGSSVILRGKHWAAEAQPDTTVGPYEVTADRPLNSALPQLVNNKSVASEGVAIMGGAWVSGNTLRRDNRPADHVRALRIQR